MCDLKTLFTDVTVLHLSEIIKSPLTASVSIAALSDEPVTNKSQNSLQSKWFYVDTNLMLSKRAAPQQMINAVHGKIAGNICTQLLRH